MSRAALASFRDLVSQWYLEAEQIEAEAETFRGLERSCLRADAAQIRYRARILELTIIDAENAEYMAKVEAA